MIEVPLIEKIFDSVICLCNSCWFVKVFIVITSFVGITLLNEEMQRLNHARIKVLWYLMIHKPCLWKLLYMFFLWINTICLRTNKVSSWGEFDKCQIYQVSMSN